MATLSNELFLWGGFCWDCAFLLGLRCDSAFLDTTRNMLPILVAVVSRDVGSYDQVPGTLSFLLKRHGSPAPVGTDGPGLLSSRRQEAVRHPDRPSHEGGSGGSTDGR